MASDYLNVLNKAQKEAVVNTEGPALVIAGAGAGKTRVLTYRIAHLLNSGVTAESILALTFTNKAAGEMKERIIDIAGYNQARFLWMGTFHSIFARILRNESDKLGYPSSYTIYDTTDSRSLIKLILKEFSLDDKVYKPAGVAARISHAKNNLITARNYGSVDALTERDRASKMPMMPEIYKKYAARCYKAGAMDFDDLLLNTNILFRDYPEVLNEYRKRFRYVLVDEYQDTNYSQYIIVKKLSESHRNICVVGDDAQSIYSFRGARIENILNFRKDYPDYKLYKLEQNYRSTKTIVNAANSIIHKNAGQIKKTVFSELQTGNKIRVLASITDGEEGFRIASDIFDNHLRNQLNWEDFAILYRTNAQSRIFEETLRKKNIPYKIYGGLSFYERKEIKDILAYFRMIINPDDEEALRRTINYPKRGLGKTTVDRLMEAASGSDRSAWAILNEPGEQQPLFTPATWKRLSVYTDLVNSLMQAIKEMNAYEAARRIAAETGILTELRDGQTPEEISRYENLQELLNAIKEFTEAAETNGDPSELPFYLESVALLTDQDNEKKEERNRVTLMTVHSAKGLEFDSIYVTGLEENLFPSLMSVGDIRDLEEERRLFYVAVTRAKSNLTLSYAHNRYKWGNLEDCKPSRFLAEIDEQFIEYPQNERGFTSNKDTAYERSHMRGNTTDSKGRAYYRGRNQRAEEKKASDIVPPSRNFKKLATTGPSDNAGSGSLVDPDSLRAGTEVMHERFGKGMIKKIEGSAPNTTALVDFELSGERKLLLRFAKLRLVEK